MKYCGSNYPYEPGYYFTAYGIAVKNGFKGTELEWLQSLIGPAGPAAEEGVSYVPQTLTEEQQAQARANIGAVDLAQVNQIVNAAVSAVSLEAMDEVIG